MKYEIKVSLIRGGKIIYQDFWDGDNWVIGKGEVELDDDKINRIKKGVRQHCENLKNPNRWKEFSKKDFQLEMCRYEGDPCSVSMKFSEKEYADWTCGYSSTRFLSEMIEIWRKLAEKMVERLRAEGGFSKE